MSKEIITDPDSPLVGMTILSGEDRVTVNAVYDSVDDFNVVKSLRLPASLYRAAQERQHPNGFSGVVREALEAYLAPGNADDVRHALHVLQHAVDRLEAA